MVFEKFTAGADKNGAYYAISEMMRDFDTDKSYADMMRYRISGNAADECNDIYYVAHEGQKALARHWMGFGKHENAVGNWGNFYTDPEYRGKGIGGNLLRFWYEDFKTQKEKPTCFLCTTGSVSLAQLYSRFGFRPAIRGKDCGPLYMPIGDSPDSFYEFAEGYYKPSPVVFHRRASIGYRHEIDCLLRFYFIDNGLQFEIGGISYMDDGLLYYPDRVGMLFSEDGHCVGWSFDREIRIHPLYKNAEIVDMW
jgi:GNAT superfamily N-acetyltransferase